jgi:anaphase-promoting complex subunit 8
MSLSVCQMVRPSMTVSQTIIGDEMTDHKCRAAELLNAIPEAEVSFDQSQTSESGALPTTIFGQNADPEEAMLEAREVNKYLMAKSLFDCREFHRCAAVFLPDSMLSSVVSSQEPNSTPKGKGKAKATTAPSSKLGSKLELPKISQRSLFLTLYAKVLSGEKRKDEDTEMVMGPQDVGTVVNKQLLVVSRYLEAWFAERKADDGEEMDGQGWLEYL